MNVVANTQNTSAAAVFEGSLRVERRLLRDKARLERELTDATRRGNRAAMTRLTGEIDAIERTLTQERRIQEAAAPAVRQEAAAARVQEYEDVLELVGADFRIAQDAAEALDRQIDELIVNVRKAVTAANSYRELVRWHGRTSPGETIGACSHPELLHTLIARRLTAGGVLRGSSRSEDARVRVREAFDWMPRILAIAQRHAPAVEPPDAAA